MEACIMKKNSKVIGMTLILAAFALMSLGSGSSSSTAKETKAITQEKTGSIAGTDLFVTKIELTAPYVPFISRK